MNSKVISMNFALIKYVTVKRSPQKKKGLFLKTNLIIYFNQGT